MILAEEVANIWSIFGATEVVVVTSMVEGVMTPKKVDGFVFIDKESTWSSTMLPSSNCSIFKALSALVVGMRLGKGETMLETTGAVTLTRVCGSFNKNQKRSLSVGLEYQRERPIP